MWGKTVRQTPSRNGNSATNSWLKDVPYHPFWPNKTPGFEDLHTTLKLVGGLEHEFYDFQYIGNVIIPTDFNSIIFQRGRSTTNQFPLITNGTSWFDLPGHAPVDAKLVNLWVDSGLWLLTAIATISSDE
jgi:hypothetical protein